MATLDTGVWFFVQIKQDYIFEQKIEDQKMIIKYVGEEIV